MRFQTLSRLNAQRNKEHYPELAKQTGPEVATDLAYRTDTLRIKIDELHDTGNLSVDEMAYYIGGLLCKLDSLATHYGIRLQDAALHYFNSSSDSIGSTIKLETTDEIEQEAFAKGYELSIAKTFIQLQDLEKEYEEFSGGIDTSGDDGEPIIASRGASEPEEEE